MDIIKLALGLVQRHADRLGVDPTIMDDIAERYRAEVGGTSDYVASLLEKRAGFASTAAGTCDENRLRDPRLRTTYPLERQSALDARVLRYGDELVPHLAKVFELTLKLELAQLELGAERLRDRVHRDADEAREALGLYVEVIDTINALYEDYGVTRRHYPCLSDEQHRDIAAIILRKPAQTIPVKRRRRRGAVAHG